jgi:hypothetical protein
MKSLLVCLALLPGLAGAQAPAKPAKLTALSLLGDTLQLVNLLPERGNLAQVGEAAVAPSGSLDSAVLQSLDKAVKSVDAQRELKLYTSTTRSLFGDPAALFVDGKLSLPGKLGEAVKQSGASHLLLVTRSRQDAALAAELPARINQPLDGLGYVVDQRPSSQIGIDGQGGLPVLAPYAFIRVALIDLADMRLKREQSIAVARRLPVTRQAAGAPFSALDAEPRKQAVLDLVDAELPQAVKALLPK